MGWEEGDVRDGVDAPGGKTGCSVECMEESETELIGAGKECIRDLSSLRRTISSDTLPSLHPSPEFKHLAIFPNAAIERDLDAVFDEGVGGEKTTEVSDGGFEEGSDVVGVLSEIESVDVAHCVFELRTQSKK